MVAPALQALAFACTAGGALGVYLASPHQRLWALGAEVASDAGPRGLHAVRALRVVSALLLAAGVALWVAALQPAAGVFTALSLTMGLWVALPYLAAWRGIVRARRGTSQSRGAGHGAP